MAGAGHSVSNRAAQGQERIGGESPWKELQIFPEVLRVGSSWVSATAASRPIADSSWQVQDRSRRPSPGPSGGRHLVLVELARPWRIGLPAPMGPRMAGNVLNSRVAPFVAVGMAREPMAGLPWQATGSLVPVLGARLDLWGPLLRAEVGWAPRTGGVSLMIDAHPDWWPLL